MTYPDIPSNGGRSRSVTLNRRCNPCSRRRIVSIEASHHPRAAPDSKDFHVGSNSCCSVTLLTVLARDDPAGSDMKGESSAMRSATPDCKVYSPFLVQAGIVTVPSTLPQSQLEEALHPISVPPVTATACHASESSVLTKHTSVQSTGPDATRLTLGIDRRSAVCAAMLRSPGVTVIDIGSWKGDPI